MSTERKPFLKRLTFTKYILIFNGESHSFLPKILAFCKKEKIICKFKNKTQTGRIRYEVTGEWKNTGWNTNGLREFIKREYDEFYYYDKELKKMLKDQ